MPRRAAANVEIPYNVLRLRMYLFTILRVSGPR